MFVAAIALALVYIASFVAADKPTMGIGMMASDHPTMGVGMSGEVSSTPPSADERMQLAKTIKEMISSNPSAVDPAVANMSTEDLFSMLSNIVSNPSVLSHVGGLISAATKGDTGALAGHAAGLLGAVVPAVIPGLASAPAPAPAAIPVQPIYATSPTMGATSAAPAST
ncbi:unnamed protein product [Phytophthora fragariaefolia]|uniref:Unnamed protein product n=1 Tax=Phytophthora fragariaefolia TaxID=1490495 RepID=A0A9W6U0S0_9STRA|nr:unnamed protein product [Phytophthora fragariaefolia]